MRRRVGDVRRAERKCSQFRGAQTQKFRAKAGAQKPALAPFEPHRHEQQTDETFLGFRTNKVLDQQLAVNLSIRLSHTQEKVTRTM